MTSNYRPIGFDIETTGSDPYLHQVIQVGAALPNQDDFSSDVGWDTWVEVPEAMAVNGFTRDRIMAGPRVEAVDTELAAYLRRVNPDGRCIPVGWNVVSFDVDFIKRQMPKSFKRIGYQGVDLNALCFTLADITGRSFDSWKDASKEYAKLTLLSKGIRSQWHDALYDARAALVSWEFLKAQMRKP
jgi:DNA polymerase III epsilon subunit-like protein